MDTITSQVLSVRLPTLEMRRALTARCEADGVTVAGFIATIVEAYLDGRLQVFEKPAGPRPSFLAPAPPAEPTA